MKLAALALAVACTGCTSDSLALPDAAVARAVLPDDAFYAQVLDPCGAPEPGDCRSELAFCVDGTYQYLLGDVVTASTYQVDDGVAVDPSRGFEFDFTTQLSGMNGTFAPQPWFATQLLYATSCSD